MKRNLTSLFPVAATALAAHGLVSDATAQSNRFLFSIDWQSPSVGTVDPNGLTITEGDILRPPTSDSMPALVLPSGAEIAIKHDTSLGLPGVCIGHPGGTPCIVEVDAFSFGSDDHFLPNTPIRPGQLAFSVDEFGLGAFVSPLPSVDSEYPVGDSAADTFMNLGGLPPGPVPPALGRNVGFADGDAVASGSGALYPGVGLKEPTSPTPGPMDAGDNLDALDVVEGAILMGGGRYFSLDAQFPDLLEGVPNSGSAMANGFVGGDVLTLSGAGLPVVYAPAFALGLDFLGPDSDDLDALILRENGIGGYQVSNAPYDWVAGGSDMLVFSVRRGSAIIGAPDSIFGVPIEEGDLLVPPVAGGVSPFPGIFVAAENLGLATLRAGTGNHAADLNAADNLRGPLLDCDGDGIEDAIAIAAGMVPDLDGDGVPDSCGGGVTPGPVGTASCFCPTVSAPCGNASTTTGCINSSGAGALLTGFGPQIAGASITSPDMLTLTTSGMPGPSFMLIFYGPSTISPVPLGNGLRCVGPTLFRLPPIMPVPAAGTVTYGPGVVLGSTINGALGTITAGSTWTFQSWFRELGPGPCGGFSNTSNALTITFI